MTEWPRLSAFYGIVIYMYIRDHGVAHFHARHGEAEGVIDIATGEVLAGGLPRRPMRLVREWTDIHRDELLLAWERASARRAARWHRAIAMTASAPTPEVVGVAVVRAHVMRLLFSDGVVRDVR